MEEEKENIKKRFLGEERSPVKDRPLSLPPAPGVYESGKPNNSKGMEREEVRRKEALALKKGKKKAPGPAWVRLEQKTNEE